MRTGFPQNGTQSTARRPESVPSGARVKAVSLVPKVSAMISGYRELAETAVVALMKLGPPRFAEIDGGCFGAGCSLALACDVRVCSPTSQFGIPALKNGLTYEPVFVRRLVEVVGSGPPVCFYTEGNAGTATRQPHVASSTTTSIRTAPRFHRQQCERTLMDLRLSGARAIVTGGSRGIGLAVAHRLLVEGARVALAARDERRLKTAADGLRAAYVDTDVLAIPTDTTDDASVRAMVDRVVAAWGGVDVLVNAAAQPAFASAPGPRRSDRRRGAAGLRHQGAGLPEVRPSRRPAHDRAGPGQDRQRLRSQRAPHRLHLGHDTQCRRRRPHRQSRRRTRTSRRGVTVVHPGMVETERTPRLIADRAASTGSTEDEVRAALGATTSLRRLVTADEVADVIVFLCSPRAVAVTGDAVTVAGGNHGTVHY